MTLQEARDFLVASDWVYGPDDELEHWQQTLNMNDVWAWATAWGEYIPDDELLIVVDLLKRYGWCGALYWMSERHEQMRSEFEDINRFIAFVRAEEAILKECPDSSQRAYLKKSYTI